MSCSSMPLDWKLLCLSCFFMLLAVADGVVWQHPSSMRVAVGTNVTLSCDISGVTGKCMFVWWLLVKPSARLTHYNSIHKTSTIAGSSETADKACLLHLRSTSQSDTGTYYCAVSDSRMVYYGNGTTLVVSEALNKDVTMEILVSVLQPQNASAPVTVMCLVSGVDPSQSTVHWGVEGEVESPCLPEDKILASDNVRAQLSIPGESWAHGASVTCVLKTESGLNLNRTISSTGEGTHSLCVHLAAAVGTVVSLMLILTAVTVCISWHRHNHGRTACHPGHQTCTKRPSQGSVEVQYATLMFAGRRREAMTLF